MPLGMLTEALEKLGSKPGRDEAETRVYVEMSVDLSRRLRDMAREHETDALMLDLIGMMKLDNTARTLVQRETFRAVGDVLEERFPAATEAAEEWLDTVDLGKCNQDGYDYHRYLVSMIELERAGK
ncbi:hypothetical protein J2X12_002868 [Pseudarthrobacter oxydans]|uniref:Uncharacterized protein n=1 Tax=Pseudarthrobacter oxydans TaxID=1671 RepID=A0AAW8NES0_PSEOX|nr:hypothetical protein [Pseudarthrobacter oxydans]MDR6794395.1 hypothetical protein [Pseudarthrobacter oxydans]MDR7164830.1 hypothetical protein [Pseudarthrobacter oxydans]